MRMSADHWFVHRSSATACRTRTIATGATGAGALVGSFVFGIEQGGVATRVVRSTLEAVGQFLIRGGRIGDVINGRHMELVDIGYVEDLAGTTPYSPILRVRTRERHWCKDHHVNAHERQKDGLQHRRQQIVGFVNARTNQLALEKPETHGYHCESRQTPNHHT